MVQRTEGDEIVFETVTGRRITYGVVFAILMAFIVLSVARLFGLWVVKDFPPALAVVSLLFYSALAPYALRRAGPRTLSIDTAGKTYRLTEGWLWKPNVWTGPIEDLRGVCVGTCRIGSTVAYPVGILRRAPGPVQVDVFTEMDRDVAERKARELSGAIGIAYEPSCSG